MHTEVAHIIQSILNQSDSVASLIQPNSKMFKCFLLFFLGFFFCWNSKSCCSVTTSQFPPTHAQIKSRSITKNGGDVIIRTVKKNKKTFKIEWQWCYNIYTVLTYTLATNPKGTMETFCIQKDKTKRKMGLTVWLFINMKLPSHCMSKVKAV